MATTTTSIIEILRRMNPWWSDGSPPEAPAYELAESEQVREYVVEDSPQKMAVLLAGPKGSGKTTLLLQQIGRLLREGTDPRRILYADFSDPTLREAGYMDTTDAWEQKIDPSGGIVHFFLDEFQFVEGWGGEIKWDVDMIRRRRIAFALSAYPVSWRDKVSGIGIWEEVFVSSLRFRDHLSINGMEPDIPVPDRLADLFSWRQSRFWETADSAKGLTEHLQSYHDRGGFQGAAMAEDAHGARAHIRKSVVRDALRGGVSCEFADLSPKLMEDALGLLSRKSGGIEDIDALAACLGIAPSMAEQLLRGLLSARLLHRMGGTVQGMGRFNGRKKVYSADHGVMLALSPPGGCPRGSQAASGPLWETIFFNHLRPELNGFNHALSHWTTKAHDAFVDFVVFHNVRQEIPFVIQGLSSADQGSHIKALRQYHGSNPFEHGYVITRSMRDFGPVRAVGSSNSGKKKGKVMRIPATLFCYWMSTLNAKGRWAYEFS